MNKNKKTAHDGSDGYRLTSLREASCSNNIASLGFHSLEEIPESVTIRFLPPSSTIPPTQDLEIYEHTQILTGSEGGLRPTESPSLTHSDVITRLINDRNYQPPSDQLDDLASKLAGMPHNFRRLAKEKYEEGFLMFGKLPVRIDSVLTKKGQITGPPRPMECPEPPPEGSKFILAWKHGDLWDWDLSFPFADISSSPLINAAKYIRTLRSFSTSDDESLRILSQNILQRLPANLESLSEERDHHLLEAFEAGVLFSRSILYKNANREASANQKRSNSSWPDIIRAALQRHGMDIDPDDLAVRLGLFRRKSEKSLTKGMQTLECLWPYAPKNELNGNQFREKVKQAKENLGFSSQRKKSNRSK